MPAERAPELSEDELLFQLLIHTKSIFTEWIYDYPDLQPQDREWKGLWAKQIIELNRIGQKKRRIQARFLGKSQTCSAEFLQHCITARRPGEALVASRLEHNLKPVWDKFLARPLTRHPFLKLFLPRGEMSINRKNWEIKLANGVTIMGRIEGREATGFQSIHPDIVAWIDEVQLLGDEAVGELYGVISATLPILASGVPNGVRTSWAYKIDNDPKGIYGFVGGRMTRKDDPDMTEERLAELAEQYGGEQSSGYLNRVLGEWGADARMTFDLDRIERDLPLKTEDGASRGVAPSFYRSVELYARDVANADGTAKIDVLMMRLSFRGDMPRTNKIWFAADHGQSASPTTLYIHFWDIEKKCWRTYHRILLHGMEIPTQAEVLHWLATEMKRLTAIEPVIGMDASGHGGDGVLSLLRQRGHPVARIDVKENADTRQTRLETDEELKKRYTKNPFSPSEKQPVPIYARWRQIAFPRLARAFYSGELRLVNEEVLIKQIAGTTDYESKNGERIYETDFHVEGNSYNHDLSAYEILGAMMHSLDVDHAPKPPEAWAQPINIGWGVQSAFGD